MRRALGVSCGVGGWGAAPHGVLGGHGGEQVEGQEAAGAAAGTLLSATWHTGWWAPHAAGRAQRGEAGGAGPCLGSMSNRRTFPSISQPPPQGTIHLHSIFTPLHMFPFQPRIIFYHQITVVIRWSRCDSEQSAHPLLSPFPSTILSSRL